MIQPQQAESWNAKALCIHQHEPGHQVSFASLSGCRPAPGLDGLRCIATAGAEGPTRANEALALHFEAGRRPPLEEHVFESLEQSLLKLDSTEEIGGGETEREDGISSLPHPSVVSTTSCG